MITCLQDTVNNPDMAETFTILRNPGTFASGGWQVEPQQQIVAYGTVGRASNRDIQALPEADRVNEVRIFHSSTRMQVTSADDSLTSDILVWRNIQYRVAAEIDQPQRGYYAALAIRMAGQ